MKRLLAGLTIMVASPQLAAQGTPNASPPSPRRPGTRNWVDTITVGRLPSGGCEWSKVRLRPGKPGTTTRPGVANERTCTVLASNYTTGSGNERPAVDGFAYVQDQKDPLPKTLNFADTFTVARRADGNCDWGKTPVRPGMKGSASYLGEARTAECWGVVYNVTLPPQDTTGMKSTMSIGLPPHVWEGPDTLRGRGRQARDIANTVLAVAPKGSRLEQMTITDDSLARVAVFTQGSRSNYGLHLQGGKWMLVGKPTPF